MPLVPDPHPPEEPELRDRMGASFACLEEVLQAHPDLRREWKYYGPKYGWSMKLFEKRRNLCFLTPREGMLRIGFLLAPTAVNEALESEISPDVKERLRTARAYIEGTGVHLDVTGVEQLHDFELLLGIKRGLAPAGG